MTVRFGLALDFWSPTKSLRGLLDEYASLLALAEKYRFDSVWAGENRPHRPEPGHVPSPLIILAALARQTSLRLGTGVTLLTVWHPLRLAYDAALLDQLCAGRLILGVGVGSPSVMRRFGISPEQAGSRMDEAIALLKSVWSGEGTFRGTHFSVTGNVYPGPFQPSGPPIWVGGKIHRSVKRAAQLGDGWYAATQYHFDLIKKLAARYRDCLTVLGKDPSTAVIALNRTTVLAETDSLARKEGKPYIDRVLKFYARYGAIHDGSGNPLEPHDDLFDIVGDDVYFCGSPESVIDSIRKYEAVGVTHFNMRIRPSDMPLDLAMRTITLLGERVLPSLMERGPR